MRSRSWRAASVVAAAAATFTCGLGTAVAHADEPVPAPDSTVETGEIDGAIVAVDVPPVPPTTVEVATDEPPVPPTSVVVAVDEPPVPPTSMPDAEPIVPTVASDAVAPASAPQQQVQREAEPQLPETGAAAARATAIVAGAAVSIGVALRALSQRP